MVAQSVAIYLDLPFLICKQGMVRPKERPRWYEQSFLPAPPTLVPIFIVAMFSLKETVTSLPLASAHRAAFVVYFGGMFLLSMVLGRRRRQRSDNTAVAFTAAGNNFELAIAVAVAVFGAK